MAIVGERVRECRERVGMTLEDVARLVGVSVEELRNCESGVVSELMWEQSRLLASTLHSTTEYLMGYDDGDVLPLEYGQPSHETMRRRALDRVNRALERLEMSAEDHRLANYFTALDFISFARDLRLITYEEHVALNKKADGLGKRGC